MKTTSVEVGTSYSGRLCGLLAKEPSSLRKLTGHATEEARTATEAAVAATSPHFNTISHVIIFYLAHLPNPYFSARAAYSMHRRRIVSKKFESQTCLTC